MATTDPTRWAGYQHHTSRTDTGALVVLVDGREAGLDTDGGRWSIICDDHAFVVSDSNRDRLRRHMTVPGQWCEPCMETAP